MGMAAYTSSPTASTVTSGITIIITPVGTFSTYGFSSAPQRVAEDPEEWAKQVSSREEHARLVKLARQRPPAPPSSRARFGFQQMARIPCYRSTRTR